MAPVKPNLYFVVTYLSPNLPAILKELNTFEMALVQPSMKSAGRNI